MDLKFFCFLLCLLQSLTFSVDSLFLRDETGEDGFWTKSSEASLLCTNRPYTGTHIWTLGSKDVLTCTRITCETLDKNPDFLFQNDIQNGLFRWTFRRVSEKYNGAKLICFDGLEALRHTVKVKDCECGGCPRCVWFCGTAVVVLVVQIGVLLWTSFYDRFIQGFIVIDAIVVAFGIGVGLTGIFVWNNYCQSCKDCAKCTGFSILSAVLAIVCAYISCVLAPHRLWNRRAAQ